MQEQRKQERILQREAAEKARAEEAKRREKEAKQREKEAKRRQKEAMKEALRREKVRLVIHPCSPTLVWVGVNMGYATGQLRCA